MAFGLNLYFLHEWKSVAIMLSLSYALLITLSLYDPKFAVTFFTFLLISRPWEFFKDELMASMPRDIFIVCFLSFLAHKIFRRRFYFQWNMASACVFFFAVWTFFSIMPSGNLIRALDEYGDVFIKGIMVYFLIVNVVDKREYILPIQSALVLGILEKAVMAFYKIHFLKVVADGERMTSVGILENSNDIAAIIILSIPFTIAFFKGISNKIMRYLLASIVFSFYSYLVWQSKSRGAILGVGSLLVVWFWLKAQNKKVASLIVLAGLATCVLAMNSIERKAEDIEGSTNNRIIYWKAGLNMAARNPLFGVGYNSFSLRLLQYTNGLVGTEGKFKTVHSNWLLPLAETGFVGFTFYIGIWIFAFRAAWLMREVHPEFILAMVSYATAITFLSHTYMLYPNILLGLTIGSGKFFKTIPIEENNEGLSGALNWKKQRAQILVQA
jgi:O-antigen ligase